MSRAADLDVVIVHHHAADAVSEAVTALRADASRSDLSIHIIVVDNGSTARERALLQTLGVKRITTGRNAGYAGAMNFAFPGTTADFIILMNEDVIVLPGCLRTLHEVLRSEAAVAGPLLYWDRDSTLLLPCTEERTRRNELTKAAGRRSLSKLQRARDSWRQHARRHWRSREPLSSTALSGALLAFRRDTWETVGPLDDGFRLYYEENDWLLRIERAGLRSMYVPAATASHLHNPCAGESMERRQWESDSFLRFGTRHYGERFMRRLLLLSERESVVPEWEAVSMDTLTLDPGEAALPLWLEVSPSPLGFPAAAARIDCSNGGWPLPRMRGLESLDMRLYLQIVDDAGRELSRCRITRVASK
ncbi:MAG: glycosyltransferase [Thermoanaerobaculia bacterium]